MPSRLSREASIYFPTAEDANSTEGDNGGSDRIEQQAPSKLRRGGRPIVAEDGARGMNASVGSPSRVGEHDPQATPSNEELVLRIKALEEELQALRAATVAATATVPAVSATAVSTTAVSAVSSSAPGVTTAGKVDAPEA